VKTIPVHGFVPADTTNHKGVRDCQMCPLGEDRTDVHEYPQTDPEVRAYEERRVGESEN
jgi:hypothetical protein